MIRVINFIAVVSEVDGSLFHWKIVSKFQPIRLANETLLENQFDLFS